MLTDLNHVRADQQSNDHSSGGWTRRERWIGLEYAPPILTILMFGNALTLVPVLEGNDLKRRFEDCLSSCHLSQSVQSVSVRGRFTLLVVMTFYMTVGDRLNCSVELCQRVVVRINVFADLQLYCQCMQPICIFQSAKVCGLSRTF